MKKLFIILFIGVIATLAQAQDPGQGWISGEWGDSEFYCPLLNAIVRDYGEHPFTRLDGTVYDFETWYRPLLRACADRGYTDTLSSPSADSASPASDGNVIIKLSSATHPGTNILPKRLQFSDKITLPPGLYSYATEGLVWGTLGRGAVSSDYSWECMPLEDLFAEESKASFLSPVDAGFFSVVPSQGLCRFQIEIRYAEGHDWSLSITRED